MSESRDVEVNDVEQMYLRDKKIETARELLAETLYNYLSPRKITRLAQQLVEDLERVS